MSSGRIVMWTVSACSQRRSKKRLTPSMPDRSVVAMARERTDPGSCLASQPGTGSLRLVDEASRVCIVGAGSSGIASCQVLHARGVPFDCFEKGSGVGGNWRYGNDNGMSSAYRSLFINPSRRVMEYASYPMPDSYPDYPHHTQIADYFDDYVDHFGFRDKIRFGTAVTRVEPAGDGGAWNVTLEDRTTARYDAVMVANGHHWDP